jgi:DNA-binding HxlR family transcriptional regulator/putative sterol carrier protein
LWNDVEVPDYGNFCPIAIATDVIADRWTPMILRELILGNTRFNDIARGLPGISRSLLVQRLKHLERKGVIETWPLPSGRGKEYHLTPAGKDLEPVLIVMGRWSVAWMYSNLDSTDVDAVTLMWWMHRRVDVTRLPHDRVIVQFDHTAPKRCSFWVVIEQGAASVCLQDPGFAVDAIVTCTTLALARVFSGIEQWREAVASGAIEVTGTRAVVNSLPRWFMWSPWANEMRAVTESLAST